MRSICLCVSPTGPATFLQSAKGNPTTGHDQL
jgi:hypothetical protein